MLTGLDYAFEGLSMITDFIPFVPIVEVLVGILVAGSLVGIIFSFFRR